MDTIRIIRPVTLAALALAAAAGIATTAQAQSTFYSEPVHLHVKYADLDTASVSGATTLYRRIQGAAHFVCGEEGRTLAAQAQYKSCVRSAVADAVSTVQNPLVTALYEGRTPQAQTAALAK